VDGMKIIAYYISDYGFGHASRSVAIIRELLTLSNNIKVIVCHSYAISFIKASLANEERVEYRESATDIGYKLKQNSLEPDLEEMNSSFDRYIENLDELVYDEIQFCMVTGIDAIISDIVPFSFKVAKKLKIPSIGISNFTWFTAYKQLIEKRKLENLKGYYSLMDYQFSLATSNEPKWGHIWERDFGFVSRRCDEELVNKLKKEIDPTGLMTIVYFGLGMKVFIDELETLTIWDSPNCIFVVSSNIKLKKGNIYKIPSEYSESQYFIAASDIVITKAGWSTIAEAINLNKPLIVLNRSNMEEDKNTIKYLKKHQRAEIMSWYEISYLIINEDVLARLFAQKHSYSSDNDCSKIAKEILNILI
jgi:uncharacterized protein (TIGR00661 family)